MFACILLLLEVTQFKYRLQMQRQTVMLHMKLWWASDYGVFDWIMRDQWFAVQVYDGLMRLIRRVRGVSAFTHQHIVNSFNDENSIITELFACLGERLPLSHFLSTLNQAILLQLCMFLRIHDFKICGKFTDSHKPFNSAVCYSELLKYSDFVTL